MANEIKQVTLPNGATYAFVDEVARQAAAAGFTLLKVESLPTASADTLHAIYLVPHSHDTGDVFDEYITVDNGSTATTQYTWEKIGNTDVDLSTTTDSFVKSYPGATSKLVTTTIPNVTGNSSVTASKAKAGTAVSIPNVTNAGSASTWSFTVSDRTLVIAGANGSKPTLGTDISITPYTFEDVTATNTTLGTAITAATGALDANGKGSSVMTGLGTPTKADAVTKIGK